METVNKDVKLHFVQQFGKGCWMATPAWCSECAKEDVVRRSIATWQDEENNVYYLCEDHRVAFDAPKPTPGVEYAPTMALMNNWRMGTDGKPYCPPIRK